MKKLIKYKKKIKNPEDPYEFLDFPKNSKKSFEIGMLIGKKIIFILALESHDQVQIKKYFEKFIKHHKQTITFLENPNFDISKIDPTEAYNAGDTLGKKKAIEFILKCNFNKKLIQDEWFKIADKIENFE